MSMLMVAVGTKYSQQPDALSSTRQAAAGISRGRTRSGRKEARLRFCFRNSLVFSFSSSSAVT